MLTSFDWLIGFTCCGIIGLLYLLYQLIEVLREYISILKEILEDE